MGLVMIIFRYQLTMFYTTNPEVVSVAADAFTVSSISHFFDFIYGVQQGSIRALTKFNHAVIGCLVSFYVLAIPLGALFALQFGLGLKGLWFGLVIGQTFLVVFFFYLLNFSFKWDQIALDCAQR